MKAALVLLLCAGCGGKPSEPPATPPTKTTTTMVTFSDDLAFLQKHGHAIVLSSPRGGRVAISPDYQGRVMTSAVGDAEQSLGFVHRAFIEKAATGTPFDNYGGEDRFWLGPEGGQYGLFFAPKAAYTFDAWQTPSALQEGAWAIAEQTESRVTFKRAMTIVNHTGTEFSIAVTRTIRLLGDDDVEREVGARADDLAKRGVRFVAYATENVIENTGKSAWTKDKGLVSVWILSMFAPAPDARVVIPFENAAGGTIVNDAYFGKVPADRLKVDESKGRLVFTADGKLRSKIGVGPARAKDALGSYSASSHLLTVITYTKPRDTTDYVNSMWQEQKEPYGGDAVNSYNDGPVAPGKPSLGGFYELETSSPARETKPGASITHTQRTFHLVGDESVLEAIAEKKLSVTLPDLR
jgi:hypothetical protein